MPLTPPSVEYEGGTAKRSYVRDMFTAIAPRYDLLNHVLSLNIDRRWRRQAIDNLAWERAPAGSYLDLCAGTLDLGAELARRPPFAGCVVGTDFVLRMLRLGKGKSGRLKPVCADALALPFPDGSFDGLVIGFGLRNLTDIDEGLLEMARVLKAGARLVVLEFSTPSKWPIRPLYRFYFTRILPRIGRLVSKHTSAYSYLPDSVETFPQPSLLAERIRSAGFGEAWFRPLTFGIATLHVGVRA